MEAQNPAAEDVIEAFNIARVDGGGVYEHTVGYGDDYPTYNGSDLVVKMDNSATGISYPDRTYERGFDQTYFGAWRDGAEQFIELLSTVGLDPVEDFVRVYRDLARGCDTDYPDYWLYVWSNDRVMIATTCNPINGDPASETVSSRQGYAGISASAARKTPCLRRHARLKRSRRR